MKRWLFFPLLYVVCVALPAHSAQSLQSTCPQKTLSAQNTVEGVYLGVTCPDFCMAQVQLQNGDVFSFLMSEDAADEVFGVPAGQKVAVTYQTIQAWMTPDGNEESGFCFRGEIFKDGRVLSAAPDGQPDEQKMSTHKVTPAPVSAKHVNITGTVETYREAGMWFAHLHTGQGKPLLIGAMGNLSDATWDCLEKAEETNQPVTVQGLLETLDDGSSGLSEKTVQCIPADRLKGCPISDSWILCSSPYGDARHEAPGTVPMSQRITVGKFFDATMQMLENEGSAVNITWKQVSAYRYRFNFHTHSQMDDSEELTILGFDTVPNKNNDGHTYARLSYYKVEGNREFNDRELWQLCSHMRIGLSRQ